MKRVVTLTLAVMLVFSLSACGKSKAATAVELAIADIGEVTLNSEKAIITAEELYNALTEKEKTVVENKLSLNEARKTYDELKNAQRKEEAYNLAKETYELLNSAADVCISGMSSKESAWNFAIWDAYKCTDNNFFTDFAEAVPGFTVEELSLVADSLDFNVTSLKNDWQNCLWTFEEAASLRGDHGLIDTAIQMAKGRLQSLSDEYDDDKYYPLLKNYCLELVSCADFYEKSLVSLNEFRETMKTYQTNIRAFKSEISLFFVN